MMLFDSDFGRDSDPMQCAPGSQEARGVASLRARCLGFILLREVAELVHSYSTKFKPKLASFLHVVHVG